MAQDGPEVLPVLDVDGAVEDLVRAFQATGMSWEQSIVTAPGVFGQAAVFGYLDRQVTGLLSPGFIVSEFLAGIGVQDVDFANDYLAHAMRSGAVRPSPDVNGLVTLSFLRASWLRRLPDDIEIKGALDCSACDRLAAIPQGLAVAHGARFSGCVSLMDIPNDFSVRGFCDMVCCITLAAIPAGVDFGAGVNLSECERLRDLPPGWQVNGPLWLSGCKSLAALPDGLHVKGDLFLNRCVALASLPNGLVVEGTVHMKECAQWDGILPSDALVTGEVVTDAHPHGIPRPAVSP